MIIICPPDFDFVHSNYTSSVTASLFCPLSTLTFSFKHLFFHLSIRFFLFLSVFLLKWTLVPCFLIILQKTSDFYQPSCKALTFHHTANCHCVSHNTLCIDYIRSTIQVLPVTNASWLCLLSIYTQRADQFLGMFWSLVLFTLQWKY